MSGPGHPANVTERLEGADCLSLRSPVALRDLELDPLPFFQGAVAIRLDRREMHEHVPATVDRDKAVAFVRVEPLDGALRHYKQLPNCARASSPAQATAEPVDRYRLKRSATADDHTSNGKRCASVTHGITRMT